MNIFKCLTGLITVSGMLLWGAAPLFAQGSGKDNTFGGIVQLDKTVHDFGDILVSDGPVTATFTVKNVSDKAVLIYNVVTSCGCTKAEWTKKPIAPGETGTVTATFRNDEKGYPFDKTLTVYFSGLKQPVVLRLRGVSHDRQLTLEELYPYRFGDLAFKKVEIKGGNMSQGQRKSGEVSVANLGSKPVEVSFSDVSKGLSVKVSPNPIPAGGTAMMSYTVTSDRSLWGKNYYFATPLVNGRTRKATVSPSATSEKPAAGAEALDTGINPELGAGKTRIGVFAYTKEDFSNLSEEEIDRGSRPMADNSTESFGKVRYGEKVKCTFGIENRGQSPFEIYKIDSESANVSFNAFRELEAGGKGSLDVTLDTAGLPEGECLIVLTLTTNSPSRPIMNLYMTGWVAK